MRRYYTRVCNFYHGKKSEVLVNKRKTIPLNGNKKISFDHIEIITRKSKKRISIDQIKNLSKNLKKKINSDIKKIKSWCASFMKFLNMNTAINIKFNLSPSDQSAEDKTYNINIQKTINGVTTNLDPLNKHFFSSDSYLDLVNLKLQHYASSIFK